MARDPDRLEKKIALVSQSIVFKGLPDQALKDFADLAVSIPYAFANSQVIINILGIMGHAVDSSNSRILDMLEKKVIQRLKRVLYTLSQKFGPNLNFTAVEIAELASTTTESSLRVLTDLRNNGIIGKSRGRIQILKPEALSDAESEDMWI